MTAIFVTGTGTDVGKTFVTAALIRQFRAAGRPVHALKPIASGFDPAAMAASDAGVLLAALGRQVNLDEIARISPWRFAAPMSPDLAARREGKRIDFDAAIEFTSQAMATARNEFLFIEGIGGIMVPLDETRTVLDWMAALRMPVLLVTGSYLGTTSHTLSALEVLASRKLDVAAVVVSESASSTTPLADTAATIARFRKTIEVVSLPRLAAGESEPAFHRIAALLTE